MDLGLGRHCQDLVTDAVVVGQLLDGTDDTQGDRKDRPEGLATQTTVRRW